MKKIRVRRELQLNKDAIIINSIESYPNSFGMCCVENDYLTTDIKGIKVDFNYKYFMRANIVLSYDDFKTGNPSIEEIKDKIIEVLK
jgi:hypothetical protein